MRCKLRSTASTVLVSRWNESKSIPAMCCSILSMPRIISRSKRAGALKDKLGLAIKVLLHLFLQSFCVGKIGFNAQDIRKPVLQADQVQHALTLGAVEYCGQIHIGLSRDRRAPHNGAVQPHM